MTTPNDSRDFYPTPDNLAWEMAYSLQSTKYGWKHLPQPILEPSAGDGALARQIHAVADIRHDPKTGELDRYSTSKAKEFDLDCVELSSDFRAKLKKDGFRVVHDDFLTFRPAKKYAAIIMNPPFSAGAAHFLFGHIVVNDKYHADDLTELSFNVEQIVEFMDVVHHPFKPIKREVLHFRAIREIARVHFQLDVSPLCRVEKTLVE